MRLFFIEIAGALIALFCCLATHGSSTVSPRILDQPTALRSIRAPTSSPQPVSPTTGPIEKSIIQEPTGDGDSFKEKRAQCTLRGRAVDASTGGSLAGCSVEVHGWPGNSERMEKHVARNGKVKWKDPERQVTGEDGRFSFEFHPPPPYQFTIDVKAPDRVTMTGRWGELEPEKAKDLGDIVMRSGARVRGKIVDTDGSPQGGIRVSIDQYDVPETTEIYQEQAHRGFTDELGCFSFTDPVGVGEWRIRCDERQIVEPTALALSPGDAERALEIRVRKPTDVDSITGTVLDDLGRPVSGANIHFDPTGFSGPRAIAASGDDGTFRIERLPQDPQEPVTITVSNDGYDATRFADRWPWGSKDVKLVLRRSLGVDLLVVDGETREPIEKYGVRCFAHPTTAPFVSMGEFRIGNRGTHPGGRTRILGLRRDPHLLIVEPEYPQYASSRFHLFEVVDGGIPLQTVELLKVIPQTVIVRRGDGSPVAGSEVELLRPWPGHSVAVSTTKIEFSGFGGIPAEGGPLLLAGGTTKPDGKFELMGPPHEPLALRLLGPGHPPVVREVVFERAGAEFEVVVPTGGVVIGRVLPPSFLKQLRPSEEAVEPGDKVAESALARPRTGLGIRLVRPGNTRETHPAGDGQFPLQDDGSFQLTGVPPGTWCVSLSYSEFLKVFRSSMTGWRRVATIVDLQDTETRQLDLDLSHLLKGRLLGQVTLNGEPLTQAAVYLEGTISTGGGEPEHVIAQGIITDERGEFVTDLWPARYSFTVHVPRTKNSLESLLVLPDAEPFTTQPGETIKRSFKLQTGTLKVRVLRPDGSTPAKDVALQLSLLDGRCGQQLPPTNENGETHKEEVAAGRFAVKVWPKNLSTQNALIKLLREGRNPDEALIDVATITVPAKSEVSIDITLPASSGY